MNNIIAYEEYIARRCEEILENNEEFKKLDLEILEVEKKLKEKLKDDIKEFLKYEQLIIKQLTLASHVIFRALSSE